jgi:DNA-directed RNA polymerase specialized sigma24 family protein
MTKARTHPHANDNRPAWFDALLVQYMPFLHRKCTDQAKGVDREDLAQEAMRYILDYWYRFRSDGIFTSWVTLMVSEARRDMMLRHDKGARAKESVAVLQSYSPASQESAAMLSETSDRLGDAAPLAAMIGAGFSQAEIGAATGVSIFTVERRVKAMRGLLAANENRKSVRKAG